MRVRYIGESTTGVVLDGIECPLNEWVDVPDALVLNPAVFNGVGPLADDVQASVVAATKKGGKPATAPVVQGDDDQ
jgi:hypothetical protein